MSLPPIREEFARNFDALQRRLSDYLIDHSGEFALMRNGTVVDFFATPGEADGEGWTRFDDGIYSIQQITAEPIELGMYANAIG